MHLTFFFYGHFTHLLKCAVWQAVLSGNLFARLFEEGENRRGVNTIRAHILMNGKLHF